MFAGIEQDKLVTGGLNRSRKGGAQWLTHEAHAEQDTVQAQGGWMSADTMKRIYVAKPAADRRAELIDAMHSGVRGYLTSVGAAASAAVEKHP